MTVENSVNYSKYRNGIVVPIIICSVMFLNLYFYSRLTTPDQVVFLSKSLYLYAVITLVAFFSCLLLFYLSIYKFYFAGSRAENNPESYLYQIQLPLKFRKYRLIFAMSSVLYFVFFAFLSNIFIYFINEDTIFSIIPSPKAMEHNLGSNTSHERMEMLNGSAHGDSNLILSHTPNYPNYQLIICCNYIGYVPMLILKISESLSVLLIPFNILIGVTISILVGLNVTLNIYILIQNHTIKISKKNFLGALGISTGLFVGCPTCTGSLFYTIAGFSSLIVFSSLNFFQILFVTISIPMLVISLLLMMKILKKMYMNSCNI